MAKFDLTKRYIKEIESWDWKAIYKEAKNSCYLDEEEQIIGSAWLGTVFGIMPSGKFYTFWTTNQTKRDVVKDSCFLEALETVADRYGMFLDCDEDIRVSKCFDYEEVGNWVTSEDADRAEELFNECEQEVLEESKVS